MLVHNYNNKSKSCELNEVLKLVQGIFVGLCNWYRLSIWKTLWIHLNHSITENCLYYICFSMTFRGQKTYFLFLVTIHWKTSDRSSWNCSVWEGGVVVVIILCQVFLRPLYMPPAPTLDSTFLCFLSSFSELLFFANLRQKVCEWPCNFPSYCVLGHTDLGH